MTDEIISLFDQQAPASDPATGQPASLTLPAPAGWPEPPAADAFHGLPGAIVEKIAPHTEADPVAILTQLLVACGALIGRGAFFQIEATRHHPNQYLLLIGDTARARKGSSFDHVTRLLSQADPAFPSRLTTGLSSGEGLVWTVRDPNGQDPGANDKRLLVAEPEFASVLKSTGRDLSTLSPTLRSAWDGRPLALLTRTAPARATDAHISIIGHITAAELRHHTTRVELANGFLNRFVLAAVRRVRLLPEGGNSDPLKDTGLVRYLARTLKHAQQVGQLKLDPAARTPSWSFYPQRTPSASRFSMRCSTDSDRSSRSTCKPRSRSGTTPPAPRPGRSSVPPQIRSRTRSTPRSSTRYPAGSPARSCAICCTATPPPRNSTKHSPRSPTTARSPASASSPQAARPSSGPPTSADRHRSRERATLPQPTSEAKRDCQPAARQGRAQRAAKRRP